MPGLGDKNGLGQPLQAAEVLDGPQGCFCGRVRGPETVPAQAHQVVGPVVPALEARPFFVALLPPLIPPATQRSHCRKR